MIVMIESDTGGRMHVYSQLELDRHLNLGWRVVPEDQQYVKLVQQEDNIVQLQKRQRGRPKR